MPHALLGSDIESGRPVTLGDEERCAGLYVLGVPGVGKTTLLLNLALHDIRAGHGLFFLDPHGDAIDAIRTHGEIQRITRNAILLNPENEKRAFGINLTYCPNIGSLNQRVTTYTKAYNVFYKAFSEEWGPWLQLIIQNTLYTFIENQEYTLAEAPRFLLDGDFRNKLVANIKYNPEVVDFWRYRFSQRRERDQEAQVDAALTRFSTFLGHPYIRDIIGQKQTTLDFAKLMDEQKIILLKFSANLAIDIKQFIGTILISELLHAVRDRQIGNRKHFSIFVDEFQNFATADFASLITEGRKFGIATTIAHQERFGQLREDPEVLGATLAAANKVLFQLTVRDAQELAPEFAQSVEETKEGHEAQLVLSPHAVEDIWERGHPNPVVMEARSRYFWLVDLLKSRPQDLYYSFDPLRFTGLRFERYEWEWYRATAHMVRRGIETLNSLYFAWMQGKRPPLIIQSLVQDLGGLFGFYPSMRPVITAEKKLFLAMACKDYNARRLHEYFPGGLIPRLKPWETYRDGQEWVARQMRSVPKEKRIAIPEPITETHEMRRLIREAQEIGIHPRDAEALFEWEPNKIPDAAMSLFQEYYNTLYIPGEEDTFREIACKMRDTIYHGEDRTLWQLKQLLEFIDVLLRKVPCILVTDPVKIPSGRYDETLRVERTQQDLINERAKELSDLPRFTAYTKTIAGETTAIHKIKTEPFPKGTNEAIIDSEAYHTKRDVVGGQIADRLMDEKMKHGRKPPPKFAD